MSKGWLVFTTTITLIALFVFPVQAVEAPEGRLFLKSNIEYVASGQDGGVTVTIWLQLLNQDPRTVQRSRGKILYYEALPVPMPTMASAVSITQGDGTALAWHRITAAGSDDTLYIDLGRRLHYGQSMDMRLSYELRGVSSSPAYVSRNTIRFEAFSLGDESTISARIDPGFSLDLHSYDCQLSSDQGQVVVRCPTFSEEGTYAFTLEALKPVPEHEWVSEPIGLQGGEVLLKIKYRHGELDWARRVERTLRAALPVLEDLYGIPYMGPPLLTIRTVRQSELGGYGGLYDPEQAEILLTFGSSLDIIVHEAAHLWSAPFAARWLLEGWAEWSAAETLERIGLRSEEVALRASDFEGISLPLQIWEYQSAVSNSMTARTTDYGYAKSVELVGRLVELVGLDSLQSLNRGYLSPTWQARGGADSVAYFQALQDMGFDVDQLWSDYIQH